ncbi:MAG: DnaJ domain-containing protein [Gammaproteobacteria bacterium]|nr:DnaJ domain-containing protein [Gammaproteobacteria bacterium]
MIDISIYIFLAVILFSFGYIAGNARHFNLWKFLILVILTLSFVNQFGQTKAYWITMFVSFVFGYLVPYAHVFEGFGESLSNFINNIRYKDAFEEIKRKEEEIEELRRQYEQTKRDNYKENREQEQKRRKQKYDERDKKNKSEKSSSSSDTKRDHYLKILGLEPDNEYSFKEYKNAYRKQASKYHPDRYQDEAVKKVMEEKFKEVAEAFQWLAFN